MNALVVLPVLIPLASAAISVLAYRSPRAQGTIGVIGSGALLVASLLLARAVLTDGVLALQLGNWPAPFGITLVADTLSAVMVVLCGIIGFAVAVYSLADIDAARRQAGFYPLLHVLLMGVCWSFLTGDLFNLYVWFEVMLIASFVLLALGGERAQLEGALKYVTLNLISSAVFLVGAGRALRPDRHPQHGRPGRGRAGRSRRPSPTWWRPSPVCFLVSFGIKAGLFPLYFWLPASYHTPPVAVSAVFAGLLTKVGVYALIRVFTLVFADVESAYRTLLVLAGAHHAHRRARRGVPVSTSAASSASTSSARSATWSWASACSRCPTPPSSRLGLLAAVFYIVHHILVKTNLFLIGGVIRRLRGTEELRSIGGLCRRTPWLAVLFLIPALSLAGIPPLSGFWAKLAIVPGGPRGRTVAGRRRGLAAGLLTLISMVKIWNEAFWKPLPDPGDGPAAPPLGRGQLALLVAPVGGAARC